MNTYKKIIVVALLVAELFVVIDQKRSFYCMDSGRCVTVWKRFGGRCYVIPYKYYGLWKPSSSYIDTENGAGIAIYWLSKDSIVVENSGEHIVTADYKIINDNDKYTIIDLNEDERTKNVHLVYQNGKIRKDLDWMYISIAENRLVRINNAKK